MRNLALALLVATGLATSGLPAWAQVTTRIEPRPFYGATVSVEEDVRVFRPLPPMTVSSSTRVLARRSAWRGAITGGAVTTTSTLHAEHVSAR
jgi:hypothetical protein